MLHTQNRLLNDKEIAHLLCVSRSWVRGQRFKRAHGKPHHFDVEYVPVGSLPRYRLEDVLAWINNLSPANDYRSTVKNGDES